MFIPLIMYIYRYWPISIYVWYCLMTSSSSSSWKISHLPSVAAPCRLHVGRSETRVLPKCGNYMNYIISFYHMLSQYPIRIVFWGVYPIYGQIHIQRCSKLFRFDRSTAEPHAVLSDLNLIDTQVCFVLGTSWEWTQERASTLVKPSTSISYLESI